MKKYKWHKIADSITELQFNTNGLLEVEVDGKVVCLANNNNEFHACSQKCPHAGGFMEEGYIDALGNIVCPIHRYKFSLKNGRNTSGEGYFLKTYPVEIREDGVFVGIESSGLFGIFK